ncbi:MAG: hypothetical protein HQ568_11730 [Calditrichaeota bacterium]|nr:hypothetical protein [Calditrichota bacterium]
MTGEGGKTSFEDELTDRQKELLGKMADKIVRLHMSVPAILFLESVRPMNYVGSQVMVFFQPLVRVFFGLPEWDELRLILERRESIGYFLDVIERKEGDFLLENEKLRAERKAKNSRRKDKGKFARFLKKDENKNEHKE